MIYQASRVSLALAQKPEVLLKEILLNDKQEKPLLVDNQVEVFLLTPFTSLTFSSVWQGICGEPMLGSVKSDTAVSLWWELGRQVRGSRGRTEQRRSRYGVVAIELRSFAVDEARHLPAVDVDNLLAIFRVWLNGYRPLNCRPLRREDGPRRRRKPAPVSSHGSGPGRWARRDGRSPLGCLSCTRRHV